MAPTWLLDLAQTIASLLHSGRKEKLFREKENQITTLFLKNDVRFLFIVERFLGLANDYLRGPMVERPAIIFIGLGILATLYKFRAFYVFLSFDVHSFNVVSGFFILKDI